MREPVACLEVVQSAIRLASGWGRDVPECVRAVGPAVEPCDARDRLSQTNFLIQHVFSEVSCHFSAPVKSWDLILGSPDASY